MRCIDLTSPLISVFLFQIKGDTGLTNNSNLHLEQLQTKQTTPVLQLEFAHPQKKTNRDLSDMHRSDILYISTEATFLAWLPGYLLRV